jgi:schlafen family protein
MTHVRDRLVSLEDGFTERKLEGVRPAELRRTLVAFANSVPEGRTAVLFIGVADDGKVVGVSNADDFQKKIRRLAQEECYPPIAITSEVVASNGRNVLAVEVPASSNRPHFAGLAYVRQGSESVQATPELFEQLVASRVTKAGAILRLKGQPITVVALGKELGATKKLMDSLYRARHECRVEDCTAQYVRLHDISTQRNVTEPWENVTVTYDEERYRPMLIVEPR